ncbi:hypothetical protein KR084_011825 [Drosophila pseudotakahashii]|nr:hypothetical protein KR084_011825 [Drosophila pseudotakahashii]
MKGLRFSLVLVIFMASLGILFCEARVLEPAPQPGRNSNRFNPSKG